MRRTIAFVCFMICFLTVAVAAAQEVPDVYPISAKLERVVVLRFKFDADLLAGLEAMVKKENIRNAVIMSGTGSVRSYRVHTVTTRDLPPGELVIEAEKAADLISADGYVIGGRIHAHITLMDQQKAFGGHLEPGTKVLTYAAIALGVLPDDTDLSRLDDSNNR